MKFCFHNWGVWSKPFDSMSDYTKVQSRFCNKCNKCQVKEIKQPWNIWFGAGAIDKQATGESK